MEPVPIQSIDLEVTGTKYREKNSNLQDILLNHLSTLENMLFVEKNVDLKLFIKLVLVIDSHQFRISDLTNILKAREQFERNLFAEDGKNKDSLILIVLCLRTLEFGRQSTFKWLCFHGMKLPLSFFEIGKFLVNSQWFNGLVFSPRDTLFFVELLRGVGDGSKLNVLNKWLKLSNFGVTCPTETATRIFNGLIVPVMKMLLRERLYDQALGLEQYLYGSWLKREESEEHYDNSFSHWVPEMTEAGREASNCMPALQPFQKTSHPNIGFFVHQASTLAHIQVLFMALEAIQKNREQISPKIYVFSGHDKKMSAWFDSIGIEIIYLDNDADAKVLSPFKRLIWLRKRLATDEVHCLVWTCLPIMLGFVSGFRLAAKQIWLSMKFHPSSFSELDGYITLHNGFSNSVSLMGREWLTVPETSKDLVKSESLETIHQLKMKFSEFDLICGTFAREETIATKEFLETIVKILKSNAKLIWLYTGRKNHPLIIKHLEDAGVHHQARFIGWVDTRLFAQVLDFYVDCWPLGSGLTGMQAMAAGLPYVFYCGPSKRANEWTLMKTLLFEPLHQPTDLLTDVTRLREIFDIEGNSTMLSSTSVENYILLTQKIIDDKNFRTKSGLSYKKYAEEFLNNTDRMGKILCEQIFKIYIK